MPRGDCAVDVRHGEINNVHALIGKYIDKIPNGCWQWTGAHLRNGYGKVMVNYKTKLAHRFFYEELVGPIPNGLHIDHLCRNRSCVNPAHLEPVTCKENNRRGIGLCAVNSAKIYCLNGHELSGDNLYVPPSRQNRRYCRACQKDRDRKLVLRAGRV